MRAHVGPTMRTFIDAHADWLTVFRLPAYAPELNPAGVVWANLKGKLINLAPTQPRPAHHPDPVPQTHAVPPRLLDGSLAQTGLTLEPP
ncbi:transposase [Microbispora siamensis]